MLNHGIDNPLTPIYAFTAAATAVKQLTPNMALRSPSRAGLP